MILAIYNNKGGCGKTTITVNLAYELAQLKKSVCVIDLDGQSNTTSYISERKDGDKTFETIINGTEKISDIIRPSEFKGVDIVPAASELNLLESNFASDEYGTVDDVLARLDEAKKELERYDIVLLDMPPSALNVTDLILNIFADKIIVPIICNNDGLDGLQGVLNMVDASKIMYLLPSRVNKKNSTTQRHLEELKEALGEYVCDVHIRLSQAIENANEHKKPARTYFFCSATSDFKKIAGLIVKKIK